MAGLSVERGIERPVLGAFERETVKRLGPNKVFMGSVSPQEQGLTTYYHSQTSCSHRPPLWVILLLSSFRVSKVPVEFGLSSAQAPLSFIRTPQQEFPAHQGSGAALTQESSPHI